MNRPKVDQASAQFKNGLLEVTIPVAESERKRREIPIEAASARNAPSERAESTAT